MTLSEPWLPPHGRPQGNMKSDAGKAAYWRMNYEQSINALADILAEHARLREQVAGLRAEIGEIPLLSLYPDTPAVNLYTVLDILDRMIAPE